MTLEATRNNQVSIQVLQVEEQTTVLDEIANATVSATKVVGSAIFGGMTALALSKVLHVSSTLSSHIDFGFSISLDEYSNVPHLAAGVAAGMLVNGLVRLKKECSNNAPSSVARRLLQAAVQGALVGGAIGTGFGLENSTVHIPTGLEPCLTFPNLGSYTICPEKPIIYTPVTLLNPIMGAIAGATGYVGLQVLSEIF